MQVPGKGVSGSSKWVSIYCEIHHNMTRPEPGLKTVGRERKDRMASEKTGNQFIIEEAEALTSLSVRKHTSVEKLPGEIGMAYGAIMNYLTELGDVEQLVSGMPYVAYYNLDMEDLDVEMGFPTTQAFPDKEEVKASQIPAGKWLTAMYKGPYAQMASTYEEMSQYMAEQGLEASGIVYEYYYNSPEEVPENELLTKIAFLLK